MLRNYLASALGGLIRPDAIALSLTGSNFAALDLEVVVRALTLAIAVNCLFKATVGASLGSREFGRAIIATLVIAAVVSVAISWLVPPLQLSLPGL